MIITNQGDFSYLIRFNRFFDAHDAKVLVRNELGLFTNINVMILLDESIIDLQE